LWQCSVLKNDKREKNNRRKDYTRKRTIHTIGTDLSNAVHLIACIVFLSLQPYLELSIEITNKQAGIPQEKQASK
jgi:hypothetical protein